MKRNSTRLITLIGIMTGLSFVLYYFELPVGFLFPQAAFLKIDFSDIPSILVSLSAGPIAGITIEFFKNILHFIFLTKEPAASGEIANFAAGVAYLLPLALLARKKYSKRIIPAMILGTLLTTIAMGFVNYFITLPLYGIPANLRLPMIITSFVPFNLLKGTILSMITLLLYPRLKETLQRFSL